MVNYTTPNPGVISVKHKDNIVGVSLQVKFVYVLLVIVDTMKKENIQFGRISLITTILGALAIMTTITTFIYVKVFVKPLSFFCLISFSFLFYWQFS